MACKFSVVSACIVLCFISLPETARDKFNKLKKELCRHVAKRHYEYGKSLEDRKILTQALEQFKIARDRGTGRCQFKAERLCRDLGEYLPKTRRDYYHFPNKTERITYRQKSAANRRIDRKEVWKRLADFAANNADELLTEADALYMELLTETNDLLKLDKKGRVVLPNGEGPIHKTFSERYKKAEGVVMINKKPHLRDAFFKLIPDTQEVVMMETKHFRIFCEEEIWVLDEIFELYKALYPKLRAEWDDEPDRRLSLFVFTDLEKYKGYCTASDSLECINARSFSKSDQFYSIICLENLGDGLTESHISQILCQMTTLFHFGITRMEMPNWFSMGLAESFGGIGAFEWIKGRFKLKRGLDKKRVAQLVANGCLFPLEDFFNLQTSDIPPERIDDYYTQCWAFLTYLKKGADSAHARKLELWEEFCYRRRLTLSKTVDEFIKRFINELPTMDDKFLEFLKNS